MDDSDLLIRVSSKSTDFSSEDSYLSRLQFEKLNSRIPIITNTYPTKYSAENSWPNNAIENISPYKGQVSRLML